MSISFRCPSCQKSLNCPESKAGKKAKCPACHEEIPIPSASKSGGQPSTARGAGRDESAASQVKNCPQCGKPTPSDVLHCPHCQPISDTESATPENVAEPANALDVRELLTASFEILKRNILLMYGSLLILALVTNWLDRLLSLLKAVLPALVVDLIRVFPIAFIASGFLMLLLNMARGTQPSLKDLVSGGPYFLKMVLWAVVLSVLIAGGLLLLVVPGIIVWVALYPWLFFTVIDKNTPGMEPLWTTKGMTDGRWVECLLVWVAFYAINCAGMLLCGVGILVTGPVSFIMMALWYCRLSGQPTAAAA